MKYSKLYTKLNYPDEMIGMNKVVRNKAIEILNNIEMESDIEEKNAIDISIGMARDWARKSGYFIQNKQQGKRYYVFPANHGWKVTCEKGSLVSYYYKKKDNAIMTAKHLAQENKAELVVQDDDGDVQERISFNKS